jgi:hypothetical protein
LSLVFGFTFSFGSVFLCITLKRNELAHKVLVYIHDCGIIIEVTTIIFSTENSN